LNQEVHQLEVDLLNALLLSYHLNRRGFEDALALLEAQNFSRPLHRLIFRAIKELQKARIEVTPQNITDWFDLFVEHGSELLRGRNSYLAEILIYSESGADDVVHLAQKLSRTSLCLKALENLLSDRSPARELGALVGLYGKRRYRGVTG